MCDLWNYDLWIIGIRSYRYIIILHFITVQRGILPSPLIRPVISYIVYSIIPIHAYTPIRVDPYSCKIIALINQRPREIVNRRRGRLMTLDTMGYNIIIIYVLYIAVGGLESSYFFSSNKSIKSVNYISYQ